MTPSAREAREALIARLRLDECRDELTHRHKNSGAAACVTVFLDLAELDLLLALLRDEETPRLTQHPNESGVVMMQHCGCTLTRHVCATHHRVILSPGTMDAMPPEEETPPGQAHEPEQAKA